MRKLELLPEAPIPPPPPGGGWLGAHCLSGDPAPLTLWHRSWGPRVGFHKAVDTQGGGRGRQEGALPHHKRVFPM